MASESASEGAERFGTGHSKKAWFGIPMCFDLLEFFGKDVFDQSATGTDQISGTNTDGAEGWTPMDSEVRTSRESKCPKLWELRL